MLRRDEVGHVCSPNGPSDESFDIEDARELGDRTAHCVYQHERRVSEQADLTATRAPMQVPDSGSRYGHGSLRLAGFEGRDHPAEI